MDFIIGFTVSRPKDCYDSRDWCYGFETMTFVVEPLLSRTMFTPFQSEGWRRKHEAGKEGESLLVAAGGSERRRSGKEELFQKEDHKKLNDKKIKKRTENLREIIRFMYICTDEKRTASDGIVLSRQGKLKKTTFVSLENITIKKSILQVGRLHFFA